MEFFIYIFPQITQRTLRSVESIRAPYRRGVHTSHGTLGTTATTAARTLHWFGTSGSPPTSRPSSTSWSATSGSSTWCRRSFRSWWPFVLHGFQVGYWHIACIGVDQDGTSRGHPWRPGPYRGAGGVGTLLATLNPSTLAALHGAVSGAELDRWRHHEDDESNDADANGSDNTRIWSPASVLIVGCWGRAGEEKYRFLATVQATNYPDSKVHGTNMGPIWGRQDPGGPHVGPMNFIIWVCSWLAPCYCLLWFGVGRFKMIMLCFPQYCPFGRKIIHKGPVMQILLQFCYCRDKPLKKHSICRWSKTSWRS